MFFLQQHGNNESNKKRASLIFFQQNLGNVTPVCVPIPFIKLYQILKCLVRRMSLAPLPNIKAGMTVEAACVLPLFLFFALNLLSVIEMLRLHGKIAYAMWETGNRIALYGYAYDILIGEKPDILDTVVGELAISYLYVREEIKKSLGETYLNNAPLGEAKDGLIFAEAELREDDIISFLITYQMKMPFFITEWLTVRTYNCYYARAWTGYEVEAQEGETVYVADTGQVYHSTPNCTHLKLEVSQIWYQEVVWYRNDYGERYSPCERCFYERGGAVFITKEGGAYHEKIDCPGLKRTVYAMEKKLAQSKKYKRCSRCGREE